MFIKNGSNFSYYEFGEICNITPHFMVSTYYNVLELSRYNQLHKFANELSTDMLLLIETFLKSNHKFSLPGFKVFRNDRFTHGGGVAIAIKSAVNHKLEPSLLTASFENICISVEIANQKILFIAAYCPLFSANFSRDLDILTSSRNSFFYWTISTHIIQTGIAARQTELDESFIIVKITRIITFIFLLLLLDFLLI